MPSLKAQRLLLLKKRKEKKRKREKLCALPDPKNKHRRHPSPKAQPNCPIGYTKTVARPLFSKFTAHPPSPFVFNKYINIL